MRTKKISLYIFIIVVSTASCTKVKNILPGSDPLDKDFASEIVSDVPANWFNQPREFSLQSDSAETLSHFFYDVNPDINMINNTLSAIVVTPQGSKYQYGLDIVSGQHYLNHKYCKTEDLWNRFDGSFNTPPVSMGIVPRVMDQLGTPQKIIIFGAQEAIQDRFLANYFDLRVIGGFIEQVCESGACLDQKTWKSRLVLVGIQKGYKELSEVGSIKELKEKVDWPLVRAFIENGQGQNKVGIKYYPAFKMGFPIEASATMNYLRNNSIFFTVEKLTQMRNSCYKLYDTFWDKVGKESKFEAALKENKSLLEKAKLASLAKADKNGYFYRRFIRTFKSYHRELKTCLKYVYFGNHHYDSDRFWFFTYLKFFSFAHDEGYTYSCSRRTWVRNPILRDGNRAISLKREFLGCDARTFDIAFNSSITLMRNLKRNHARSFRFIDYDRSALGTHNKLYSVVPIPLQKYECSNGKEHYLKQTIFPKDIRWKNRAIKKSDTGGLFYN